MKLSEVIRLQTLLPSNKKVEEAVARDPKKSRLKSANAPLSSGGGAGFQESAVDLEQVSRAYHTDSYIRRAIDRYTGAMFKSGWEFKSKNDKASEYVWTRFKLMAEATGMTTDELFRQMANDFVLFGNAFVFKSRAKKSVQVPGVQAVGYTGKQPVAGYFVLPPTTVQVEWDEFGNVLQYQQLDGAEIAETEIVHMYYKRPTGRPYGIPFIHNVLQDVLLLRQIEDNVYRLIHKHLFPKQVLTVGLPQAGFEAGEEEIEEAREELRAMSTDSILVLPERYKLEAIGGDSTALDVSNYLKYFRQRIFTGLGVSDSVMGIGDTANKSTSDNMSADLNDGVKDFQETFAMQLQQKVINEILFEGGFDPTLNPDDEVVFSFIEIEQAAKIARENHAMQMFMQNAITFEEMRMEMNRDVTVDENRLQFKMMAVAPAESAEASAASAAQTDNQNQPENQNGKQSAPDTTKRESGSVNVQESKKKDDERLLTSSAEVVTLTSELGINGLNEALARHYEAMRNDLVVEGDIEGRLRLATTVLLQSIRPRAEEAVNRAMKHGMSRSTRQRQQTDFLVQGVGYVMQKMDESLVRLFRDLETRLRSSETMEERARIFTSSRYRVELIAKTECYRAYNIGLCLAAKESGQDVVTWNTYENACEACRETRDIHVQGSEWLDEVPPHHPGCGCTVTTERTGGDQ